MRPIIPIATLLAVALSVALNFLQPSPASPPCRYGVCRFDQIYAGIDAAGDTPEAIAALVNADPANPMVWCAYAEALSQRGDTVRAEAAFDHAVTLGPAMAPVLMRAVNFDFTHSLRARLLSLSPRILSATGAFDQILFSYLQRAEVPVPSLLGAAIPAAVRPARSWLAWLRENGSEQDLTDTWTWMQHSGLLDEQSAGKTVWTLWYRGSFRAAHALWTGWLGTNPLLLNTRFETVPRESPFDWALGSVPAVAVARTDGLEVRFSGSENVDFYGVRQFTVLPPGRYRLAAEISSDNLTTDKGPFFHVFDPAKPGHMNVATTPILGTVARSWVAVNFTVPPGTEAVTVELERRPSERFDNRIQGTLHVYQVSLTPEAKR